MIFGKNSLEETRSSFSREIFLNAKFFFKANNYAETRYPTDYPIRNARTFTTGLIRLFVFGSQFELDQHSTPLPSEPQAARRRQLSSVNVERASHLTLLFHSVSGYQPPMGELGDGHIVEQFDARCLPTGDLACRRSERSMRFNPPQHSLA